MHVHSIRSGELHLCIHTLNREQFLVYDLRSTLNAQRAHAVNAHLTHIHALVADLHHTTLEVLLVEHVHLVWTDMHEWVNTIKVRIHNIEKKSVFGLNMRPVTAV